LDTYVGPYRILKLINRGGQGSVYLGYDKRLHRRVAIKIYSLPSGRAARKQLLREARLVASIQSPKVVQIHDVIESETHLALVMEYVPGCSLEELLAAVRLSLSSVLIIGADIAGALALARQEHIVHGDVKAPNVLITADGRAKLTDFGISRNVGEVPAEGWSGGSLSALSPEQYLGQPLDERADLFALGALMYRMLSGEQPFFRSGKLDPDLLLNGEPRPLEELVGQELEFPVQLSAIIAELLRKDPQHRPANTRGVRQVLRAVSRELPLSSRNSLLGEAQPFFRPESPQDIPPLVPEDLGQGGRSALAPEGEGVLRIWQWFKGLSLPGRAAVALVLAALAGLPLVIFQRGLPTPVRFEEPETTVDPELELPAEISRGWLVAEVKRALGEQLGTLKVTGSVGAAPRTTLYSAGEPQSWLTEPEQLFRMALRCTAGLCVFAISREQGDERFNQQSVLFPDMSVQQWKDIVHNTTLALYP
jgi:serine/threonine protein kinase